MDSDALLHPIGPQSAGTYWARRAVVVAGLVVVVLLLANALAGSGGGSSADRARSPSRIPSPVTDATSTQVSPAPATPPSAATAPAASPRPLATCADPSLVVTAYTDARSYPAGVRPVLTMTVKNVGATACTRDLGPGARGMTVRSGVDRIWSSDDCEGSGSAVVTLAPGGTRSYAVRWSRLRSHPRCPTPGPAGRPGTYRLYATLDGITSAPAAFSLR